ncbi:MAG: alanine--glyoxylate aminotransferase family protein [Candidatus Heimdallarchaeota archaeon]|nr:alanine--glyoxylate aminotransferase family protein [Candidatus Heimdallarchaeota archaeon]MCK4770233.1 alanine--glyoxylate aminotransferase family protein [Candidatus Heimdallarchaeota archaeon]
MHKKLFIPGPTEVDEEVLKAQAKYMIGHRSQDFTDLYDSVLSQLRKFFKTEQHVLVIAASGTIFMDITARNLIRSGKKALCCINGSFSDRMHKAVVGSGKEADRLDVEWGKAIKPEMIREKLEQSDYDVVTICYNETSTGVKAHLKEISDVLKDYPETLLSVDAVSSMGGDLLYPEEMGTDLVYASSQKCFAMPPGLAIGVVSQKALDRASEVEGRGLYTDLVAVLGYYEKKKQTPSTPAISLLYALDFQLKKMLKEGAEGVYQRHKAMADYTHKWALDRGFGLFAEEGYRSITVTTVANKLGKDVGALNKALGEKGMILANGYGKLKDQTFRIGHMGDHTLEDIKELLNYIDEIWELK